MVRQVLSGVLGRNLSRPLLAGFHCLTLGRSRQSVGPGSPTHASLSHGEGAPAVNQRCGRADCDLKERPCAITPSARRALPTISTAAACWRTTPQSPAIRAPAADDVTRIVARSTPMVAAAAK